MAKTKDQPITAPDDKLLHLCTLWHRQSLAVDISGADDDLSDHRTELLIRTERQIAATPAETPAGLFAKLAIYENELLMTIDPGDLSSTERLLLSLITDIRRLLR